MKYILIFVVSFYKKAVSPLFDALFGPGNGCRYQETCSEYYLRVVKKQGAFKGTLLFLQRLSTCHPFSSLNPKYE